MAGSTLTFTVTALDVYNNTTPAYSGTIHFTTSDGQATPPGNATLTNGVGVFTTTLKTAGTQTVTGTDAGNSSLTATATAKVSAAAATHLVVMTPTSIAAGNVVALVGTDDQFGNRASSYTGTVHISSSDASAELPGQCHPGQRPRRV